MPRFQYPRFAVEKRRGRYYVGGKGPLKDNWGRLIPAEITDFEWSLLPELPFDYVALAGRRIRHGFVRCARCRSWFYGPTRARLCPACLKSERETALTALNARRAGRRLKARLGVTCRQCGEPLDAERSTKAYCSNACRQEAYRVRRLSLTNSSHRRGLT
jgi:hypothetical protein